VINLGFVYTDCGVSRDEKRLPFFGIPPFGFRDEDNDELDDRCWKLEA